MSGQINELQKKIHVLEIELNDLKYELKNKIEILQKTCKHSCYISQNDGDYHRSKYYYTCVECQYWTTSKPTNAEIKFN